MKAGLLIAVLAAQSAGQCRADTYLPVDTIDPQKLSARAPSSWVNNALLPAEDTMPSRAYAGDVSYEKAELVKVLQRVMRAECLPPQNLVRDGAMGFANLRNGSDFLLLHYRTAAGFDIRVMDEAKLCLMVTVPARLRKPLSEVAPFVWQTAASVLKFPEIDGKGPQEPEFIIPTAGPHVPTRMAQRPASVPSVVVMTDDLGRSKVGGIEYGPMSDSGDGWYSGIGWWSDGQRVLFNIAKLTTEDYVALRTVASPRPAKPRVFRSRMTK